jgi:hypothetical protein
MLILLDAIVDDKGREGARNAEVGRCVHGRGLRWAWQSLP